MRLAPALLAFSSLAMAAWPNGPFTTSGRWIKSATGVNVTYTGVNWPGSAETMVPEGLQYQSVQAIVSKIKSLGLNSIRLTFAIEMIDAIFNNGGSDVSLQSAFTQDHGTAVLNSILKNNPSFKPSTTRLEVYDAIAAECARQEIYVHLDNHVSKASWCCTPFDGNSWPGDTHFSAANWTRGLAYMAEHGKQWPSLVSMGLRNELRPPLTNFSLLQQSYNWESWYSFSQEAAAVVHKAHPGVLIFLSGMDGGVNLQPVVEGTALTPSTSKFSAADFGSAADKLVLELHYYNILGSDANCTSLRNTMRRNGFSALEGGSGALAIPVVLSEFGFAQDAETWKDVYASCLHKYLREVRAGWMYWVLAGSYYVREGKQDYDEPWGLLNHDWSDWRSKAYVDGGLKPLINSTYAGVGLSSSGGSSGSSGPGPSPTGTGTGTGDGSGILKNAALRFRGGSVAPLLAAAVAYNLLAF